MGFLWTAAVVHRLHCTQNDPKFRLCGNASRFTGRFYSCSITSRRRREVVRLVGSSTANSFRHMLALASNTQKKSSVSYSSPFLCLGFIDGTVMMRLLLLLLQSISVRERLGCWTTRPLCADLGSLWMKQHLIWQIRKAEEVVCFINPRLLRFSWEYV